jgi:hypothetical protein
VLLDDLHQAGAETLGLLETVATGLAGSRLLLAAYHPAEAGLRPKPASGRLEQARVAWAAAAPLPPDFFSVFATVRAMAVVAVGDRVAAQALVTDLAPISGLLAGTASSALALQPVAQTLGELSAFLGHRAAAARHFGAAEQVARLWGSRHWIARAQAARDRLG